MRSKAQIRYGNVFDSAADLIVIPCSANGHVAAGIARFVVKYDLPRRPHLRVGLIQMAAALPPAVQDPRRRDRKACYAAVRLAEETPGASILKNVGKEIGRLARSHRFAAVSVPVRELTGEALDFHGAADAFASGFFSEAPANAVLMMYVTDPGEEIDPLRPLDDLAGRRHEAESRPVRTPAGSLAGRATSGRPVEAPRKRVGPPTETTPARATSPIVRIPTARKKPEATVEVESRPVEAPGRPAAMRKASRRNAVFISYAHRDRVWLDRLRVHLRPLEREHNLEIWDDSRILPGTRWREEIKSAIDTARVAILLVSADFLASDFIDQNELPPLLHAASHDGAVILPVIVSACGFQTIESLSGFQAVNDPRSPLKKLRAHGRDEVWVKVAEAVRAAFRQ